MVKPTDIYALCGLLSKEDGWTYRALASELEVPHAVVQRALARADSAGLYLPDRRQVHLGHFEEFALHALRFLAPGDLGPVVPGIPAAWAAPPMAGAIRSAGEELPPVWPAPQGRVRGQALKPLHEAAPASVAHWPRLGELLSIVDSLRAGDARIRSVAGQLLSENLRQQAAGGQP